MINQASNKQWNTFLINYLIPFVITAGVAIVLFGDVALIADRKSDTLRTFNSLASGLDGYYEFKNAWKPRLFSNALALVTVHISDWILARTDFPMVSQPLHLVVGLWTSGWYVLTCFLFIYFFKKRALFYIFGLYACISFGYLSGLREAPRVYPWDLPILFFFAAFVIFLVKEKYWWIFFLIPISIGFKETGIILCALFLFIDVPWKQRFIMFFGTVILSLGVKILIDWYTHAPLFFTMETRNDQEFLLTNNLRFFQAVIPYFVNSGTLIALFLLPSLNKKILYLKWVSIPFVLGIFLFGVADEFRIWFELIPFSLYALDVVIYSDLPVKISIDGKDA